MADFPTEQPFRSIFPSARFNAVLDWLLENATMPGGLLADRPFITAQSSADERRKGRLYYATDTDDIYVWTGTEWKLYAAETVRFLTQRIEVDDGGPVVALRDFISGGQEVYLFSSDDFYRLDQTDPDNTTAPYGRIAELAGNVSIVGATFGPDNLLYGVSSGERLYTINPVNGVLTDLGALFSSIGTTGGLFFSGDDLYFAGREGSFDRLFQINPDNPGDESGNFGEQGTIAGLDTGFQIRGAAVFNDTVYVGADANVGASRLYTLNLTTRAATLVGATSNGLQDIRGLAAFGSGLLAIDTNGDELWNIDPSDPDSTSGDFGEVGDLISGATNPGAIAALDIENVFYAEDGTTVRNPRVGDVYYANDAGTRWVHEPAGLTLKVGGF